MIFKKIKAKEGDIFKNKIELTDKAKEIFKTNSAFSTYPFIGALISTVLLVLLVMITKGSGIVVLALILWYLLTNIIIAYFNVASAICTKAAGYGKKVGFSDGTKEAGKKFSLIVNWAFLQTFGSLFMSTLADIKLTKKFTGEFPWGFVASFVIPFITFENKQVSASIEDSQKLIKKNWGKNTDGDFKFQFISFIPFLIALVLLIFSSVLKDEFITYSLIVLTIFVLLVGMFMNFTLRTIFYSNLYLNLKSKSR